MINYSSIHKLLNGHAAQLLGDEASQIEKLEFKIQSANLPSGLYEKAQEALSRVKLSIKYGGNFSQLEALSRYFDWITAIPWNTKTQDVVDLGVAREVMNRTHFGLDDVKKRILEYLSVLSLQKANTEQGSFHAPILFFVGLAGTGKTTFAKTIAEAMGRKFARIPFGGLSSALDLRGLSKVQPEAEPGLVMKALVRVGSGNPVILLDELDRVTPESRAAIMGVLLELLDPQQNQNFIDHYLDFPFDLSRTIFIATANNTKNISTALMDRLELVQMPNYRDDEKVEIAKNFILPRLLKETGLAPNSVTVDDVTWQKIARLSGYDPGIRSVERKVESIVRRAAYKIVSGQGQTFAITDVNAKEFFE